MLQMTAALNATFTAVMSLFLCYLPSNVGELYQKCELCEEHAAMCVRQLHTTSRFVLRLFIFCAQVFTGKECPIDTTTHVTATKTTLRFLCIVTSFVSLLFM